MVLVPTLVSLFGKRKVMTYGGLLAVIGNAIGFLNPYSLPIVLISTAVSSFGQAPVKDNNAAWRKPEPQIMPFLGVIDYQL